MSDHSPHHHTSSTPLKVPFFASSALTPTHTCTKPLQPRLPLDIFLLIRSVLTANSQKATAVKLMQCSKAFYDLFLPVLRYEKLELRAGRMGNGVFEGLMLRESHCFSDDDEDQSYRSPFSTYPFPTPTTHQRKLSLLQQCKHLTIYDLPSAVDIVYFQKAIGPKEVIFPNIEKLVLGCDLILALAMELDKDGCEEVQQLSEFINPKEICVWFPSLHAGRSNRLRTSEPPSRLVHNRLDYVQFDENRFYEIILQTYPSSSSLSPNCCADLFDKSQSLRYFLASFQPSSLTFHNVSTESLIYLPSVREYRVFFSPFEMEVEYARSEYPMWKDLLVQSMSLKRAIRISEGLPWSLGRDKEEEKSVYVDAEIQYEDEDDVCTGIEIEEMGEGDHEEVEEGELGIVIEEGEIGEESEEKNEGGKVERLVKGLISSQKWYEQAGKSIVFAKRDEVAECGCCGGK
ncbi:hypothetical protein I302_106657 [Kwoniella bestiolae CBS 10118]|uniref:Uncharacterized protein n=1 Tax=Kwoniella bestiolae CBS 10118 TaxID=1296100 RepID=A0A1B9G0T2_9TREE|nr:hypothetical protein I302_06081 [Kwoniella bestiolae CBS 10118]OCF24620.1 hypothetical protein I302_06081 [Kwoniella bestiolae CBS 10118]